MTTLNLELPSVIAADAMRVLSIARRIVLTGEGAERDEAEFIAGYPLEYLTDVFAGANRIRIHFRGEEIHRCRIANVKSGKCEERCDFCRQSAHFNADSPEYPLVDEATILREAEQAEKDTAAELGLVASGYGLGDGPDFEKLLESVTAVKNQGKVNPHASLGIIPESSLRRLKDAGLEMYHHNLETARRHHPSIVHSHTYDEEVSVIRAAKKVGLKTCSGGILGMGETEEDRIDFAYELADLAPDTIPLNFYVDVHGTPLFGKVTPMEPREILRVISLYRFVNPRADILIAAGRAQHLRDLQSMIFFAGASGMMIGDFLTTPGRTVSDDVLMLRDLGMA
ncbi:MAG: biotin synthase BioB [Planctomycetes bacterium]|nr:biotin synthase BioB [Planctomycetota bacterium]